MVVMKIYCENPAKKSMSKRNESEYLKALTAVIIIVTIKLGYLNPEGVAFLKNTNY
jgi:hypothetical protein